MTLRYFPLDGSDFRLTMGLQALRDRSFLDIDEHYENDIAEKRRLLVKHRDLVYSDTEGTQAAQEKIHHLVRHELAAKHPEIAPSTEPQVEESPLVRAALLIQEDLVLMRESSDGYVLAAACVCFPTGWNLIEKAGQTIKFIHQPVPGLNDRLGSPIDRFFRNLKSSKRVERFNWGLYDSSELFQPGWWRSNRPVDMSISAKTVGEKIFFRVERQTLQRLHDSKDILFTIRIFHNSLAEICGNKDRAERLLHGLQTMDPHMRAYKSLPRYEKLIMDYLGRALV
ncbi:DUF3445 domain-containing protein [Sneathiella sp. CAU 1612]|uniref:DUF3445 domain-containing protein n=1 Tax=Sneathiella sedimenti TaxID=2816034 RepID=A0ABS3F1R0_9PROT|nr:DUF3445 domain-containing protein [Sneathiella sedimenti]MBO0332452.1 DUF3445 domain-containing protein [Sneathiella sedimenti]